MAMEELESFRPVVPKYTPGQSLEDEEHNLRQLKYATAKQEGFDILMNLLRK